MKIDPERLKKTVDDIKTSKALVGNLKEVYYVAKAMELTELEELLRKEIFDGYKDNIPKYRDGIEINGTVLPPYTRPLARYHRWWDMDMDYEELGETVPLSEIYSYIYDRIMNTDAWVKGWSKIVKKSLERVEEQRPEEQKVSRANYVDMSRLKNDDI